jgi:TonB family protein
MTRVRTLSIAAAGVICVSGALLRAQQGSSPNLPSWPPAGVYRANEVDGPPKLLKKMPPVYPAAAIQGRIEGIVRLACVVMADGSVGEIQVVRSLDSVHGVDAAAIASVKEWQFSPAMKDGKPAAVAIEADVAFTLRNGPPRTLSWPDGFEPAPAPDNDAGAWQDDVSEVAGLRIEFHYPPGWTLRKNPDPRTLLILRKNGSFSTFSIARPRQAPYSLDHPLTPVELQRAADEMERRASASMTGMQSIGVGQAPAASHIWAWQAFKTSTVVTPVLDPSLAPLVDRTFESIRAWFFEATAGNQAITVTCFALVTRNATDADKRTFVAQQGAVFGEMIRRMKISVVP